jgi:hypothetical protein
MSIWNGKLTRRERMSRMIALLTACVLMTGCLRVVPSLKVLETASPTDFVGSWSGEAVDRPDEGTERSTMSLVVPPPGDGAWTGLVSGAVVDGEEQSVKLALRGNKLAFRMPAETWPMDIWLGLESDAKTSLLGVGLPAPARGWEERTDSYSIRLQRD